MDDIDVNDKDGDGLIDPQLAISDPPAPITEPEPEVNPEPDTSVKAVTTEPELEPPAPKPTPWWENTEYMSQGITSEEEALRSIKEQRQWTTQTTQENAKLKRRDEAYRKHFAGELDTENVEHYIAEQEHEYEKMISKNNEDQRLVNERINAAIEVGKIKHPGIVTDENMKYISALAMPSTAESPLDRLEYGVEQFKKLTGVAEAKKVAVQTTQADMKKAADMESASKAAPETPKGAWDMSSEEWSKSVQSARFA